MFTFTRTEVRAPVVQPRTGSNGKAMIEAFAAAVRKVLGRYIAAQKIEALRV